MSQGLAFHSESRRNVGKEVGVWLGGGVVVFKQQAVQRKKMVKAKSVNSLRIGYSLLSMRCAITIEKWD
jgi:hypothetical protein